MHFPPRRRGGVYTPKYAPMNSRGAATECSPGREPGVFFRHDLSPGAKESFGIFRPSGAPCQKTTSTPGSRPGPHSVAAPRLNPSLRRESVFQLLLLVVRAGAINSALILCASDSVIQRSLSTRSTLCRTFEA